VLEETYYIIGYALPALLRFKISEEFFKEFSIMGSLSWWIKKV
jgi:hypothetical protein